LYAFLTAYGELLIGLGLVFGVLTRVASVFGMLLMMLLWLSAGYPGTHVAIWRYFGASLDWSVFGCLPRFCLASPKCAGHLGDGCVCGKAVRTPEYSCQGKIVFLSGERLNGGDGSGWTGTTRGGESANSRCVHDAGVGVA
jgi:hypothetical protein